MKIKNSNHKVAIFCGSMFGSNKEYKNIAVKVTQYLARKNMISFTVVAKMD